MNHANTSAAELAVTPFRDLWDWVIVLSIFLGIGTLAYVSLRTPLFDHWIELAQQGRWSSLLLRPTILWVCMGIILLAFRTSLWLRYRPFAPATVLEAPMLTVVIPAYNEGQMIEKSIVSVARADYPRNRLQVVV